MATSSAPAVTSSAAEQPTAVGCNVGAQINPADLSESVLGSFSKPDVHEIVGDLKCPPADSDNNASVLARESGNRWLIVHSAEATDFRVTRTGRKIIKTGRGTALVLVRDTSGNSGRLTQSVFVLDYSAPKEPSQQELVWLVDTSATECEPDGSKVSADVVGVDVWDTDHDGDDDVRIQVRAGRVDCHDKPKPKLRTLEFELRDGKLEATAVTRGVLSELKSLGD